MTGQGRLSASDARRIGAVIRRRYTPHCAPIFALWYAIIRRRLAGAKSLKILEVSGQAVFGNKARIGEEWRPLRLLVSPSFPVFCLTLVEIDKLFVGSDPVADT